MKKKITKKASLNRKCHHKWIARAFEEDIICTKCQKVVPRVAGSLQFSVEVAGEEWYEERKPEEDTF